MVKVAVIGGGAAGMMAAISAAQKGAQVTLYERNEKLGKKIYITGKGRCNVTNARPAEEFFSSLVHGARFMRSSFSKLDNTEVMKLFESWGVPLKVEQGGRVFPVSDKSNDIIRAMERQLQRLGVQVKFMSRVQEVLIEDGAVKGLILEGGRKEPADSVIVATGGLSYPSTGSTGDGYLFAEKAGHRVEEASPALVPINLKGGCPEGLSGVSLKNVALVARKGQKELHRLVGEMMFAHFGITGPIVLSMASLVSPKDLTEIGLSIDYKPGLTAEQLDARLLRELDAGGKREMTTVVRTLLPTSLGLHVLETAGISPHHKACDVSRVQRKELLRTLKEYPLAVEGYRSFSEAIVTRGGVALKEINPSTMQSRKVKGLFFAGEVMDVDAMTGGYNLQAAFSSGHCAGENAADITN